MIAPSKLPLGQRQRWRAACQEDDSEMKVAPLNCLLGSLNCLLEFGFFSRSLAINVLCQSMTDQPFPEPPPVRRFASVNLLGMQHCSIPLRRKTISIESSAASARHLGDRAACSHKTEFSFLNGNLIVPASQRLISHWKFFRMVEEKMFGELSQSSVMEVLLFLAIVSLTLVSTIDLFMQAIKQEKNTDKKY
jgi:hypothetical protein